jgi:hypothetical protein
MAYKCIIFSSDEQQCQVEPITDVSETYLYFIIRTDVIEGSSLRKKLLAQLWNSRRPGKILVCIDSDVGETAYPWNVRLWLSFDTANLLKIFQRG